MIFQRSLVKNNQDVKTQELEICNKNEHWVASEATRNNCPLIPKSENSH